LKQADFLREGVRVLAQELMELEVSEQVGAERHERRPERTGYRNGYQDDEVWALFLDEAIRVVPLGVDEDLIVLFVREQIMHQAKKRGVIVDHRQSSA